MSKKSVELAKKAEEEMKKVEELEKALKEAREALALAKKEAKGSGKFSEQPKEEQPKEAVEKPMYMSFLQKNKLNIISQPGVLDIVYEDNPPRLLVIVQQGTPEFTVEGLNLEFIVQNKTIIMSQDEDGKNVIKEEITTTQQNDVYHRSITGEAAKILGVKEAIGPHSTSTRKTEAYEAWIKRNAAVKIVK